jgi:hypothetical protein
MQANRSRTSAGPPDNRDTTGAEAETGRVLRFEPRRGRPRAKAPAPYPGDSPVESLDKYARHTEDREDYVYRMRTNVAAIVVVGLLIWCGYWLFDTLAEMRKAQDCVLSGRTNCFRIDVVPPPSR